MFRHSIDSVSDMVRNKDADETVSAIRKFPEDYVFAVVENYDSVEESRTWYEIISAPFDCNNPRAGYMWRYVTKGEFLEI